MPHTRIALDETLASNQGISAGMASKLMSYLETILSADQVDDVKAILDGEEAEAPSAAMDRAMRRHADKAKGSAAAYAERFPLANRLAR